MAKKRRKQEKPALGGLAPIKKNNIVYLDSIVKNIVCDKVVMKFRNKPNNHVDYLEVYGTIEMKHSDGTIINSHTRDKPLFIIKDKGALVEYDVYEENVWNQVDIDNPAYTVDYDELEPTKVTRIYWVDGQIDDGDGGMMDNEIDIEPYQKKGRINPTSGVDIIVAEEPLADIQANIGDYLKTLIKGHFNSMY